MVKRAQFQIQQMVFMIVGIFIFFILAGLFMISIQYRGLYKSAEAIQQDKTTIALSTVPELTEFNYPYYSSNGLTLDKDKLLVLASQNELYDDFWPFESIEVLIVYPKQEELITCPALNCNYFKIYNSGETEIEQYADFVSICQKMPNNLDKCEIGKLLIGVKQIKKSN